MVERNRHARLQRRMRLQQRRHHCRQTLASLDELADAHAEPALADDADPQAEVLQRAAQVRLDVEDLGLQQLAGGQQPTEARTPPPWRSGPSTSTTSTPAGNA